MTPSQLMQALADAGAPMEAIIIALRALEEKDAEIAARDAAAAAKRAKDAERKRIERSSVPGVRGQSVDSPETVHAVSEDPALSLSPNENNSNPHTHTHPDNTSRARGSDFPRPDWAEPALWADFLTNRKAKRLKNTATAYRGFLSDIDRLQTPEWPPPRLLEYATAKGWGAIYEPEEMRNVRPAKPASNDEGPRNPYVRAVAANQAARLADERGQPGCWP